MDVLSDVLAVMRTGRPVSARAAWRGPFGQRFATVRGSAGFQVVLQGTCWLIAPDAEPTPLGPGDVVFMPHGRGHALASSPDMELAECGAGSPQAAEGPVTATLCGAYQLDPTRAHPLLRSLPELIHLPARLGRHQDLRAAIDLLAAELDRPRLGTDALIPALLETLLLYLLRAWFDDQPPETGWAAALNDTPVAAALQAIHRDPARPWTVASLAAEAGLSRAPFARRFAELAGRPPLTYLTWWRMVIAAGMLRDTSAPLTAIAGKVGYASEFAFAHAFKRVYGMPPGRFRASHTGRVSDVP
ncbi:AraC family transcriptional regulator [Actinocrispum sp. NPDC049592]|uniref:AraC family transcriptional regulator n=1 Tax=Actinocrispum sp. NPDC049592 TaxID=3154835 RepID=UPI00343F2103